jgi:hypothetical protein
MSDRESLDTDLAIMVISAPVWICGFIGLVVLGWWGDRKQGRES